MNWPSRLTGGRAQSRARKQAGSQRIHHFARIVRQGPSLAVAPPSALPASLRPFAGNAA